MHLFGDISSPGCALFTLKATANDYESFVRRDAADFVRRNFYVDDGPVSVSSIKKAAEFVRSSIQFCHYDGFKLHKFISNHREVLNEFSSTI